MAIVSCTLPLPIKSMEVFVVIVSIQVKALEKLVIPKPIPLIILEIRLSTKVILIDNITHAFGIFKTLDIILNDTPVVEGPWFQLIPLVKPINTTSEQHVDDLAIGVKEVVLDDWFRRRNLVFKGGDVNPFFQYVYNNWLNQLVINEAI